MTAVMRAAGVGADFTGVDPAVLEAAAKRGTVVHKRIANEHLHPRRIATAISPAWAGYWKAYHRFRDDVRHVAQYSEVLVQHPAWHYIGHVDRIGFLQKHRALIDWKCVASLDVDAVAIQLAAYRLAWNVMHPEEPIRYCAAVQLYPNGRYKLYDEASGLDIDAAEPVWLAALTLYHARVRMGRVGAWLA